MEDFILGLEDFVFPYIFLYEKPSNLVRWDWKILPAGRVCIGFNSLRAIQPAGRSYCLIGRFDFAHMFSYTKHIPVAPDGIGRFSNRAGVHAVCIGFSSQRAFQPHRKIFVFDRMISLFYTLPYINKIPILPDGIVRIN